MLKLIKNDQREMNMFYFTSTPEEVDYYIQMTAIPWWTGPKWRLKYFRPVATLSHLIDYNLWGSNPLPYHINNVIWYALLVTLLYLLYCSSFLNCSFTPGRVRKNITGPAVHTASAAIRAMTTASGSLDSATPKLPPIRIIPTPKNQASPRQIKRAQFFNFKM